MPLSAGDRLGHYEVLSLLGKGGMGEVYRARDTQLKRDVALKVLPAAFSSDPDRLARSQREAELLASLDHPNIGHIYGIVQADQNWALVLALIEGPTLEDRIKHRIVSNKIRSRRTRPSPTPSRSWMRWSTRMYPRTRLASKGKLIRPS